jgi:hypothetical protein
MKTAPDGMNKHAQVRRLPLHTQSHLALNTQPGMHQILAPRTGCDRHTRQHDTNGLRLHDSIRRGQLQWPN